MDDYQYLLSSTFPPSPQANSYLEQAAANTRTWDLAVKSDAFVSIPGMPSKVHVMTSMGNNYGYKPSAQ